MKNAIATLLSRLRAFFSGLFPKPVPEKDTRTIPEFHADIHRENLARFRPNGEYDLSRCAMVHVVRGKVSELYFPNHFGTWTVRFETENKAFPVCAKCGNRGHERDTCTKKDKMFKEETLRQIMARGEFSTHYVTPKIRHRNETEWKDAPRYAYLIDARPTAARTPKTDDAA